jgi:TetR/AcrR family transcriptional repressor of nem operon
MARSKEFDIDTVLGKAMTIFWQQGYEKTSMQDLVSGMGIHKRSMYDTLR